VNTRTLKLRLMLEAPDRQVVLEVADRGMEIPPEAMPRIFNRVFRVDQARSRERGGAGLGLPIVKSIGSARHGQVQADSKPGYGSRFPVELPLIHASSIKPKQDDHEYPNSEPTQ